jgi:tRNA(Ile)-lysidine synthetase-like protein
VTLARRWVLRVARGRLWLEPPFAIEPYSVTVSTGDSIELPLPGWWIRVREAASAEDPAVRWRYGVPGDVELTVRAPEPGDSVVDGRGRHRLSRLLASKLPRHLRPSWPLVCAGATIIWVPGVWESRQERVSGYATMEVLHR